MNHLYFKPLFLAYAHKSINEEGFIFPITGLILENGRKISVGNVDFVDRAYLEKNILHSKLCNSNLYFNEFSNIKTFAIIDLSKFGKYKGLCIDGDNSLALQILKQSIGAIYLSIFNKKKKYDDEKRIIISNKGVHEVDEGLNSYIFVHDGSYRVCSSNVAEEIIAKEIDFDINNIKELINILTKKIEERTEFENKICKALELLYSVLIESYASERVIKLVILLNFIFREDDNHKFDSDFIGRKLKIIFNVIDKKQFIENIPQYICPEEKTTEKISSIIIDIYSRVRNNLMHGKIEWFTEYSILNAKDLIPLKVTAMELINSILKNEELAKNDTTKDFNKKIEEKEKERIARYKNNK